MLISVVGITFAATGQSVLPGGTVLPGPPGELFASNPQVRSDSSASTGAAAGQPTAGQTAPGTTATPGNSGRQTQEVPPAGGNGNAGGSGGQSGQTPAGPGVPAPNVLVDEQFTDPALRGDLWEVMTYPKAYRNNEEQAYRPSQVSIADGNLQIRADRDTDGSWHSGEVHSKWNYAYGDFEVRLKLSATGQGVWPAAWLMGTTDHWPNNGEIDIMENINGSSTAFGTLHGGGTNGHWQLQHSFAPIDITEYHTYKISKQPGTISWWVDGTKRGEWSQSQTPAGGNWPFENHSNFGLLNLAIGGNWPGASNASTPGSIIMYVDYFKVTGN